MSGFCTECGVHIASFDGLSECPKCKTRGIPCDDADQVTVSINWHELHILCVWAENYQRARLSQRTVYAIASRLEAQHPTRTPLTLARELGVLAKDYEVRVEDAALRHDIATETGEEVGLYVPPPEPGT